MKPIRLLSLLLVSLTLMACGGGGGSGPGSTLTYTGSRTEALVDDTNALSLAIGAAGATGQAVAEEIARDVSSIAIPLRGNATDSKLFMTLARTIEENYASGNTVAYFLASDLNCSSGTSSVSGSANQGSIQFSNCELIGGNGAIVDGSVSFSVTFENMDITSLNVQFIDFQVTYLGDTQTVNSTISCNLDVALLVCESYSDYVGLDGRVYRLELDLIADNFNGSFDIDATLFDPENGFTTIDSTVSFNNCPGGVPETGSIVISGAGALPRP